jgi:hypothetical protein
LKDWGWLEDPVYRSSQPTDCTEQVETCHTLLLRFDAPLPVLKIPAFPLDRTRQQRSPYFLITPLTWRGRVIPWEEGEYIINELLDCLISFCEAVIWKPAVRLGGSFCVTPPLYTHASI